MAGVLTEAGLSQLALRLKDGTVLEAMIRDSFDPMTRNGIFRGASLGTEVTDEQWEAIYNGTFYDLYIGDYWKIDGATYRIAGFDYAHDQSINIRLYHHIAVVPDYCMVEEAQMYDSGTNAGGYAGSLVFTTTLPTVAETVEAAFGEGHLFSSQLLATFSSAVDDTGITATTTATLAGNTVACHLMTELMVFGNVLYGAFPSGSASGLYNCADRQLPLFALAPGFIGFASTGADGFGPYWLQDPAGTDSFAYVSGYGVRGSATADSTYGVRPYFLLIGE